MAVNKIWVIGESFQGKPLSITLELLTKARELAGTVEAFHWGDDAETVAGELGAHGAAKVYSVGDVGDSLPGAKVAAAMQEQIASDAPDAVLFGMTYDQRDIAGRLSVRLDAGVITNAIGLSADGDGLTAEHAIFGGTTMLKSRFTSGGPALFMFRPKSFTAEPSGGGAAEVQTVQVPDVGAADAPTVKERHVEERTGPKLDEAPIVVSGGRGLGQAEKYEMIEELAKLLKGAPGASRAIVDAGWVPYAYQVGQTGKTVKPTVYIACGISGATQHMVGMKGAKNIIAINKDPDAPIFSISDLGIVGDVHQVVPKLIDALKNR
jgi:electron transfer flavoprotein alpha subunit